VSQATRRYLQTLPSPARVDDEPCDVCYILATLLEHNWTLAFSGDSMMYQTYAGFECEVLRRPDVYNVRQYRAEPWPHRNSSLFWKDGLRETRERSFTRKGSNNTAKIIYYYGQYRPILDNQEVSRRLLLIFETT
jgi:hypothetical protein